ncbi:MAG: hypothetical protein ACOYNY_36090 [Caldilineaceae bacterium]
MSKWQKMINRKLFDVLEKSLFPSAALSEIIRQQNGMIASIGKQLSEYISSANLFNFSIQIPDIYSSLKIDTAEWVKAVKISSDVFDSIKTFSTWTDAYSSQLQSLTESLSFVGKRIAADFAAMNLSAFNLSSLGIFDGLTELLRYHKDSAEVFKAVGWTIAPSMDRELREKVVLLHQQNKARHISQVIIGYYHRNSFEKLRDTVATWETSPLFSSRMHIFKAALKAHCEGSYTLSVPTLLPQIEGILNEYVKVNNLAAKLGKIEKVYNAVIGDLDEYPLTSWAIANTLLYQLQTNTFTFTNFEVEFRKSANKRKTTRHTVLHGIATNYDKPIHSLKAFVLLDALSCLQELDAEKPA